MNAPLADVQIQVLRDRLISEQDDTVTSYSGSYLMSAYDALVSGLKA